MKIYKCCSAKVYSNDCTFSNIRKANIKEYITLNYETMCRHMLNAVNKINHGNYTDFLWVEVYDVDDSEDTELYSWSERYFYSVLGRTKPGTNFDVYKSCYSNFNTIIPSNTISYCIPNSDYAAIHKRIEMEVRLSIN